MVQTQRKYSMERSLFAIVVLEGCTGKKGLPYAHLKMDFPLSTNNY